MNEHPPADDELRVLRRLAGLREAGSPSPAFLALYERMTLFLETLRRYPVGDTDPATCFAALLEEREDDRR